MSFNLGGLTPYTDQLSTELVTRAVLKPQSVSNLTVRPNLTAGTTSINVLGVNADIKNYDCGFGSAQTGSNTTIFTQVPLVNVQKMMKEDLCPQVLRDYWLSSQMSPSSYQESVPFEQAIADLKVRTIQKYIEETIWQGDGGDLDGLIDQISVGNGAISGVSAASDFSSASTAYAGFWKLVDALALANPAVLQEDDLVCYVSAATYSKLVQALQAKGNSILLQYPNISNVSGSPENSFIWPGTNIKVFLGPGIKDLGSPAVPTVILGPKKYAFFGTGIMNDESKFRFFYDPSVDIVKFYSAFSMGTAAISNQFISTVA
jgi:hypothetical protein